MADPDQAWILGELIRYLEHNRSGALEFSDMGESWTQVRDAVTSGTLRGTDKGIADVVARFDALLRFAGLSLGRRLGTEAMPVLTRKELADPSIRASALAQSLVETGQLSGAIRVPDTVGDLVVTADLRAKQVTFHVDVGAPAQGRPTTRVNWLARQLKNAPDGVRVESFVARSRASSAAELLGKIREDPTCLVTDPTRELRSFRVAQSATMGSKRGRGRGAFIDSVLDGIDTFYAEVLGDVKAWSAAPPRLRQEADVTPEPLPASSLSSTDISSQDGPETQRPQASPETTP